MPELQKSTAAPSVAPIGKKPTDEHQFCPKCGYCVDCKDCAIWGCGAKEDQDELT